MKRAIVAAALVTTMVIASPPAHACGVVDLGDYLVLITKAIAGETTAVSTPIVELAGGNISSAGAYSVSGAIGYAWGEHESGMFPGSTVSRVLLHARESGGDTAIAATYGWYENQIGSAGVDFGAEALVGGAHPDGVGPTARVMFGLGGIGVQLTGTVAFGSQTQFVGVGELVVDVMDLGGNL